MREKPLVLIAGSVGNFYQTSRRTAVSTFRRPFQVKELVSQAWFVANVALVPTPMVAKPFCVIVVFQLDQLLIELGATNPRRRGRQGCVRWWAVKAAQRGFVASRDQPRHKEPQRVSTVPGEPVIPDRLPFRVAQTSFESHRGRRVSRTGAHITTAPGWSVRPPVEGMSLA
jgi:hypothetical protein